MLLLLFFFNYYYWNYYYYYYVLLLLCSAFTFLLSILIYILRHLILLKASFYGNILLTHDSQFNTNSILNNKACVLATENWNWPGRYIDQVQIAVPIGLIFRCRKVEWVFFWKRLKIYEFPPIINSYKMYCPRKYWIMIVLLVENIRAKRIFNLKQKKTSGHVISIDILCQKNYFKFHVLFEIIIIF